MIFNVALEITECFFMIISSNGDYFLFKLVWYYPCETGILHYALKKQTFTEVWNIAWYILKYLFLKLLKKAVSMFHNWRVMQSAEDQELSGAAPGGRNSFLRFQAVQWVLTLRCKAGLGLRVQHAIDILWCWCNLTAARLTLLIFQWDLHCLTLLLSLTTLYFCSVSPLS